MIKSPAVLENERICLCFARRLGGCCGFRDPDAPSVARWWPRLETGARLLGSVLLARWGS
jgi:hypothetical protein